MLTRAAVKMRIGATVMVFMVFKSCGVFFIGTVFDGRNVSDQWHSGRYVNVKQVLRIETSKDARNKIQSSKKATSLRTCSN
jgi:hypothetical protein